jgi:hypothetical protein
LLGVGFAGVVGVGEGVLVGLSDSTLAPVVGGVVAVEEEDGLLVGVVVVGPVTAPGSGRNGLRAVPERWTAVPFVVSATGWFGFVVTGVTEMPATRIGAEPTGGGEVVDPPPRSANATAPANPNATAMSSVSIGLSKRSALTD